MSLISVQPPRLLSGQTQWTRYLLLFFSYSEKGKSAQLMTLDVSVLSPFVSWVFSLVLFFNAFAHTDAHTDFWSSWSHLWAEYHCKVCLPSWLLPLYCPMALCAGAFCVSLAGIGLFTVNKWEQRRLGDWAVPLLEWRNVTAHTAAPQLYITLSDGKKSVEYFLPFPTTSSLFCCLWLCFTLHILNQCALVISFYGSLTTFPHSLLRKIIN